MVRICSCLLFINLYCKLLHFQYCVKTGGTGGSENPGFFWNSADLDAVNTPDNAMSDRVSELDCGTPLTSDNSV